MSLRVPARGAFYAKKCIGELYSQLKKSNLSYPEPKYYLIYTDSRQTLNGVKIISDFNTINIYVCSDTIVINGFIINNYYALVKL